MSTCDSNKKDLNNCGMLCWFQDGQNNCGSASNELELSFNNNKLCCMKNVRFDKHFEKLTTLNGYNCSLNKDTNTLHLGNIINWPNTKVLFVPQSGQDTNKMYEKLLRITQEGTNNEICNFIQQTVWPPPPQPPSPQPHRIMGL